MNTILRISEAASLALHASAILAANSGHPLVVGAIASTLGASEAHLSKVMQDLARAGLVTSVRGPRGGFALTKNPEEITLLNVYEAIEGPMELSTCISLHQPNFCQGGNCILGGLTMSVNKQVREYLSTRHLSDFTRAFSQVKVGAA